MIDDAWDLAPTPPTAQFHLLITVADPLPSGGLMPVTLSEVVDVEYRESDDPFTRGFCELPTHEELYARAFAAIRAAHPELTSPAVLHFSANRNRLT